MFRGGRSRDRSTATTWPRAAFTLAALLAVFLQAFVVQTHVHAPGAPLALGYVQPADDAHDNSLHVTATSEHQLVCAVCQALASAGAALMPSATLVLQATQTNAAAIVALALAPRVHTHSWRSRAPPSLL